MADPNIIFSGLCQDYNHGAISVRVDIYRLENEPGWSLEVINEKGTSIVWDDLFDTDQAAFEEFLRTVEKEGVESFLDDRNIIRFPG